MREDIMETRNCAWETFKADGAFVVEKLKEIIREGNVRRVVVEYEGRTIAEFPLTAGVIGAVLAPVVAAVAAIVALLKDCTIHVERAAEKPVDRAPTEAATAASTHARP
jgi:hypothetical protein